MKLCRTAVTAAIAVAGVAMLVWLNPQALAEAPHAATNPTSVAPEEAMRRLREGNERFVSQQARGEHKDTARREEVAIGQHPFAIVLGCADSRVPPELVFDQGLGDLFVIRVAGEVAPPEVIGSIEYAVEHLGCHTIIVLGHERCGAVEAALKAAGSEPEGNLGQLLKEIIPAIETIDRNAPDALDEAVKANAQAVARTLQARSKLLDGLAQKKEIAITPARYDLDSGKVEFMDQTQPGGSTRH